MWRAPQRIPLASPPPRNRTKRDERFTSQTSSRRRAPKERPRVCEGALDFESRLPAVAAGVVLHGVRAATGLVPKCTKGTSARRTDGAGRSPSTRSDRVPGFSQRCAVARTRDPAAVSRGVACPSGPRPVSRTLVAGECLSTDEVVVVFRVDGLAVARDLLGESRLGIRAYDSLLASHFEED